MSEGNKKKWVKPKLIILTRGEPEERVLVNCKTELTLVDSATSNTRCRTIVGNSSCSLCSVYGTS